MPEPLEIIAPTIVRFSHQGYVAGGRKWAAVTDVSVDEFAVDRHTGVRNIVPRIVEAFQDHCLAPLTSDVNYQGASWIDLDSLEGESGFQTPIAGHPSYGGQSAAGAAPNTCYLIHKNCAHNRRQRTGRMYLPGVMETHVDGAGVVDSAQLTALTTTMSDYKAEIAAAGPLFPPTTTAWRVVHILTYSGVAEPGWPNGRPTSWNSTDVTSATPDTKVATQRRRLR